MTKPRLPVGGSKHESGSPLERARGLARLAFATVTRVSEGLPDAPRSAGAVGLDLDLSDPAQRLFGDYELLERIGEGGMGVVYRARQLSLDREVAVKLLSAGPWASPEFIARFEREAQNAARMQHPNIVTVFETGSCDGLQFFSMRLVEGRSLATLLKSGTHPAPKAAAALLRSVAEAVAYAHSLGVLHLDLKPGNVLMDANGVPHVADFGLARRLGGGLAIENEEVSGTPAYMAPEQARTHMQTLTVATDIWGMGAILYELLTGSPPFRAGSAQDTLTLVAEGQVRSPRRWRPSLPLDLQAIVMKCLRKDPAQRYASARALADDLARFIEGRPVQARPLHAGQRLARWAKREPKLATTITCAVAALLVGLIATLQQWHRAENNAHFAQSNARVASARLWDSRAASALNRMDSGDGWKAAPLLLANLSEMEARGDSVRAVNARKQLGIIENSNSKLIDVLPAADGTKTLAISPDTSKLAFSGGGDDLRLVDIASGRQLWRSAGGENPNRSSWYDYIFPEHMEFTPDGRIVLVSTPMPSPTATFPVGIFMSRVDTGSGQWLPPPTDPARTQLGYSADGRHAITFDRNAGARTWVDGPWRTTSPLRKLPYTDYAGPVLFAPDLRSFAYHAPGYHGMGLFAVDTLRRLWYLDAAIVDLPTAWVFSPDSRWLLLGNMKGQVQAIDNRTHEVQSLLPQPLTQIRELSFSKDGRWLAAATGRGGIYLWSWPERRLLVWPFGASVQPMRVRLDRSHARVFASGVSGSAAIWGIPETRWDTDRGDAVQLGASLDTPATLQSTATPEANADGVAWAAGVGLLAHAATRRVLLERLRPPILKASHAAPLKPSVLAFDGKHLVTVHGRGVSVLDSVTEKPLRGPFAFPQAAGFAELTRDGRTLVVTAGRRLYAIDMTSGKPRFPPVDLINSPQHVELNPDGSTVAIGRLDHDAHGMAEVVEIHALNTGALTGKPVRVRGLLDGLLFDPRGARLVAWNFARVTLRDGHTLEPIAGPLADLQTSPTGSFNQGSRTSDAAFDANGGTWLATNIFKGDKDSPALQHYLRDGSLSTLPTSQIAERIVPMPGGVMAFLADPGQLQLMQRGGGEIELPDVTRDTTRSEIAASADGRWLARVQKDGVVLFDALARTRIASLRAPLPAPDIVFQLAFSPDGNRLLARSLRNRLLVWDLAPDSRSLAKIERELALRDVGRDSAKPGTSVEPFASDAERAALRKQDPGALRAAEPATEPGARMVDRDEIPARDPGASLDLVDLTRFYTFGLGEVQSAVADGTGDYGWMAPGIQRFLGTDYDVRGGIQLASATGFAQGVRSSNPLSISVPSPRPYVATLELLLMRNPSGFGKDGRLARMDLAYADGGTATLWIRDEVDFWHHFRISEFGQARVATFGNDARAYAVMKRAAHVYAATFANPHPRRRLRSITFSATPGNGDATVILAVTVKPASAAALND